MSGCNRSQEIMGPTGIRYLLIRHSPTTKMWWFVLKTVERAVTHLVTSGLFRS